MTHWMECQASLSDVFSILISRLDVLLGVEAHKWFRGGCCRSARFSCMRPAPIICHSLSSFPLPWTVV